MFNNKIKNVHFTENFMMIIITVSFSNKNGEYKFKLKFL